jgi:hypothetical protein
MASDSKRSRVVRSEAVSSGTRIDMPTACHGPSAHRTPAGSTLKLANARRACRGRPSS